MFHSVGVFALWLCGTLATLAGGIWAIPRLWRAGMSIIRFVLSLDAIARIVPVLLEVGKQFRPNSGTSFVDRVGKIERQNAEQSEYLRLLGEAFGNHGIALEKLSESVAVFKGDHQRVDTLVETYVPREEHEKIWEKHDAQFKQLMDAVHGKVK